MTMTERVLSLLVKDPAGAEWIVPLDRDVLTIGRDPSCTIRIDSPYVSRQHARIELHDGSPLLIDLGSRNGSLLDGERVDGSALLTPGNVVGIADATITCLAEAAPDGTTRFYEKPSRATPADLLRVDAQLRQVHLGGTLLERTLSKQEFDLLSFLYDHQDRVCTSQELGDAIWGSGNWDKDMLHRLVHRLKRKVEPSAEKPRYLQTIPWIGYRLTP